IFPILHLSLSLLSISGGSGGFCAKLELLPVGSQEGARARARPSYTELYRVMPHQTDWLVGNSSCLVLCLPLSSASYWASPVMHRYLAGASGASRVQSICIVWLPHPRVHESNY